MMGCLNKFSMTYCFLGKYNLPNTCGLQPSDCGSLDNYSINATLSHYLMILAKDYPK
jgi:hypothetical protein